MPPAPVLPPGPWIWVVAATNTAFAGPWGTSFTANLTPDKETGLGKWTEEMFIATMKTGRHEGKGRPLLPPMPYQIVGGARRRGHEEPVRLPAVARAGEEPGAGADRSGGEAVMTRLVLAAGFVVALTWASWRAGRAAAAVRHRPLRRQPARADRPGEPRVLAAVSAVVGRRREGAVDLPAAGHGHRHDRSERVGVPGRHAFLERVHVWRTKGRDAVSVARVRQPLGFRHVCLE